MADAADVARLVQLNGGQLVGKTRLQKSAYFLDVFDFGFGFDFSYHRFGPYSEDLTSAVDDAKALNLLKEDSCEAVGGIKYAVFVALAPSATKTEVDVRRQSILGILREYSAIEIELAATADFLDKNGFHDDPWTETHRRKASKFNQTRLERSKQLLTELKSL